MESDCNSCFEIDLAHESGLRLKQSHELLSKQVGGYDNLGFTK